MRAVLPILASLVLVTGGVLWLRSGDAPPPLAPDAGAASPDDAPEAVDAAGAALAAVAEAEPSAAVDAAVGDGDGDLDIDREEVEPASGAPGPRVVVVRGAANEPVPGAIVFFVTESQARARLAEPLPPAFEWPERTGQRAVAGPDGAVTLPPVREAWFVTANFGEEFGFQRLPPRPRTFSLRLERDERLVVAVQRPDGSPAPGVPIALVHQAGDASNVFSRVATGPDGRATLPHFQLLRPPAPARGRTETFTAMLRVPAAAPIETTFPGRPAPHEPVLLLAPWLGRVELLLTDQRGTPLLSAAQLWLAAAPTGAEGPQGRPSAVRGESTLRVQKPTGEEPVSFEPVPVATALRIGARLPYDFGRAGPRIDAMGPMRDGETVRVNLPLPAAKCVLAGRLSLEDGSPVASQTISLAVWHPQRVLGEFTATTIADGRFDLVGEPLGRVEHDALEIRWTTRQEDREVVYGARLPCRPLAAGERRELGEVVLRPLPPLASGIVVDDLGEPVAGAAVDVQELRRNREGKDEWPKVAGRSTRTAPDGTFAIHGDRPPGALRLWADTDRHFGAEQPMPAPAAPCTVRITRHGFVTGRALLPDWTGDGMFELRLVPNPGQFAEDQLRANTRSLKLSRSRGGRFHLEPLRAGLYTASVHVRNLADPALVLPGVLVAPGPNREPRLAMLDLRQALFRYRLRAFEVGGRPLAIDTPLVARFLRADGSRGEAGFRFRKGNAEVISPQPLLEFLAFAPGCAPTVVTLPPGDHDIVLQSQIPARITLPGVRALCGDGRRVRVSTILTGATGFPESLAGEDQRSGERFAFPRWDLGKSSGAWLGEGDTVEVPLVLGGEYEIVLRVHATASERSAQVSVPLGTFRLRVDGQGEVVVTLDTRAVREALRQVDERQRQANERAAQRAAQNPGRGR